MNERSALLHKIYHINAEIFDSVALEVFHYQAQQNPVYRKWIEYLQIRTEEIQKVEEIPFLPIQFYKNHKVVTGKGTAEKVFRSSGTTGQVASQHLIYDLNVYHHSCKVNFEKYFGKLEEKTWLALLPSYMERDDASLIDMVQYFMSVSHYPSDCGFYLHSKDKLIKKIEELAGSGREVFLIGVTFALLDWLEVGAYRLPSNLRIIETGGMKGRRKEITRTQLHRLLKEGFQTDLIYSEYGMTEMNSQAYLLNDMRFYPGPGLRAVARSVTDPLGLIPPGKQGLLNIIDLYNIDSCGFIATEDVGIVYKDGSFEVLGRSDNSEMRGCNLMIQS